MIYGVTALIFGWPNIVLVTRSEDLRWITLLTTSILVVSRFVGYIKLAGFTLLDSEVVRTRSSRIKFTLWVIAGVLLANAAFYLYRFGLTDMSVVAVSASCLVTSGILISHLLLTGRSELSRAVLMRMVSGVLIALGCANICITNFWILSPLIGLITLFFGIYTERKSLMLALRQTFAAAGGAAGAGVTLYFIRWYLDPSLIKFTALQPPVAIAGGLIITIAGIGYYFYSRRLYSVQRKAGSAAK